VSVALILAAAYLLGSLPTGYLVGRLRGVDIRTVGSRNVGATNVFRVLGTRLGVAVMAVDIAKGIAAVILARAVLDDPWPLVAAGAAIVGHVYPVWLRFHGGKGVAVAAGALIGLVPLAVAVLFPVWLLLVGTTRYVSVGSILCAVALTPVAWAFGASWPTLVFAGLAAAAVVWRHRGNLGRLLRGTELRIDFRPRRDLRRARRASP
jgi:acyl phosphate:glycerol-3-phosphate acyltransferase